jgi:phosphoserine phosphatase RsbU/P
VGGAELETPGVQKIPETAPAKPGAGPLRHARLAELRHSLRTAINHVLGYAEMLTEDAAQARLTPALNALNAIRAACRDALADINRVLANRETVDASELRELERKLALHRENILSLRQALRNDSDLPREWLPDLDRIATAAAGLSQVPGGAPPPSSENKPAALPPSRAATGSRLLVVDDNALNRNLLGRRLERQGYTVVEAPNGMVALDRAAAEPFDLVLLDIMMPVMDGFEALKRLKAGRTTRHIPVIVISALDEIGGVVRAIEMGAEDYLFKPFDPVLLRARVGALLDKKRLRDELRTQEKLASLGALTAGVAHEIRNPLNFVLNFAELAGDLVREQRRELEHLANDSRKSLLLENAADLAGNIAKIREHGARANNIIESMLAHSRGQTGERQLTDFNALVREFVGLAFHGMRARDRDFQAAIEGAYDPAVGKVSVVPQDLSRVFLNVAANAFWAMRQKQRSGASRFHAGGGRLYRSADSRQRNRYSAGDPRAHLRPVLHHQTGRRRNWTGTFHRLRDRRPGAPGRSPRGIRTRRVYRIRDLDPQAESGGLPMTLKARSIRALIVDDEPDIETLIRQRFKRRNGDFQFVFARNGQEALDRLEAEPDIGLVVTDLNMPVMDGLALLGRVNALNGRIIKSVVLSAYGDMGNIRGAMNRGAFDFLTKPIDFQDFETTLRRTQEALDTEREGEAARLELAALNQELEIAGRIQKSILPQDFFPEFRDFSLYAEMVPARHVGGDLYDFFMLGENRLAFLIGDVSGKGIPAALFMAVSRTLLQATALQGVTPAECLRYANRILGSDREGALFVTVFYAVLDLKTGELEFARGGHNPPYLVAAANPEIRAIAEPAGPPVGLLAEPGYETGRLQLAPDDTVFLFTDGITELANTEQQFYGDQRLRSVLESIRSAGPRAMVRGALEAASQFAAGAPQADDITALAVQWTPQSS